VAQSLAAECYRIVAKRPLKAATIQAANSLFFYHFQ
jgi:uncharacterized small protein (DUF1192 family)